jgi:hypothetical protein
VALIAAAILVSFALETWDDLQLLRQAEAGDAEAQLSSGWKFARGSWPVFHQDAVEAVKWYRKAADQGLGDAEAELAKCYRYGKGVRQNDGEARRWYLRSVEHGSAEGAVTLGYMEYEGLGGEQSAADAVGHWEFALEHGRTNALFLLGITYRTGADGVPKDEKRGVAYIVKAADADDRSAQAELGYLYERGASVPQDQAKAVLWLEKGDTESQYRLGTHYASAQGVETDLREARRWMRTAAQGEGKYKELAEEWLKSNP